MVQMGFRKTFRNGLILTSLAMGATVASQATPLTYSVNRTIGKGSVTGFIQTDGTLGILSAKNFINWNLTLSDGKNTFQLFGPLSGNSNSHVLVTGTDVGAFNNLLVFNFSGIDYGTLLFFQGASFSGFHYYCDSTQPYLCIPGETVVPLNGKAGYQTVRWHGTVVIGVLDAAPEPGTLGLVLLGGSWLGLRLRRLITR